MKRLLVIGGGLAGLSAAWHAKRAGAEVCVLELTNQVGGVVQTIQEKGYLIETGPNTLTLTPAVGKILASLGLEKEVAEPSPAARKRYIVRRGKLVAVPMSPWQFAWSRLLSLSGKVRLLREPWVTRRTEEETEEESLGEFARRRFGVEAHAYGFEPFAGGVFAGDPERLAVRHAFPRVHKMEMEHGSILKAAIDRRKKPGAGGPPRSISFREGMATLPRALAAELDDAVILNAQLATLTQSTNGTWQATWKSAGVETQESFDGVVLAVPAHRLAALPLPPKLARDLQPLAQIEHSPVSVVVLGYERPAVKHLLDGFGALVPAVERLGILGVLFPSSLFAGRAPEGSVLLNAFVGGARWPELAALTDEALYSLVEGDLEKLLKIRGSANYRRIIRWPNAIPQYNLDHAEMLKTIESAEQTWPGLALAGSYRGGVSVGQCLETGGAAGLRAINLSPTAE